MYFLHSASSYHPSLGLVISAGYIGKQGSYTSISSVETTADGLAFSAATVAPLPDARATGCQVTVDPNTIIFLGGDNRWVFSNKTFKYDTR